MNTPLPTLTTKDTKVLGQDTNTDQDRHNSFVEYWEGLIPILHEKNLIGRSIPASIIASISRNYKKRLGCRSYTAQELTDRILEYDSLIVSSTEITASIQPDSYTMRDRGYIGLYSLPNCINSGFPCCNKSPEQIWLDQERVNAKSARLSRQMERARKEVEYQRIEEWEKQSKERKVKERLEKEEMQQFRARSRGDYNFPEDENLLKFLRSQMRQ